MRRMNRLGTDGRTKAPLIAPFPTVGGIITRDQPNSREKKRDFTIEFLKCAKFHGKFTEGV